ncbi:EAL domain-containing protein [Moritella sp.]|uniref:EAL domain-containing protein n=1 Tax=Moritella sp. TaxID=78556 RepID=UPI001DBE634F|nr:EAL domain-containing protein [Moritella sp.]MCJ8351217.1 EAL domain-containing protein [Moritella sp.]NQZ41501.1 EAL domain-containing protein [Moritella sp.]
MHYLLSLFLISVLSLNTAFAQVDGLVIDSNFEVGRLGLTTKYFEDKTNSYTFDYLSQRQSVIPWVKSNQAHLNFGFSDSTFWFKGEVVNKAGVEKYLILDFGDSLLDYIDLYLINDDSVLKKRLGTRRYDDDNMSNLTFATGFKIGAGETIHYFIRIKTSAFLQTPLTIWNANDYIDDKSQHELMVGIFIGLFLMMICYLVFLYIHLQEPRLLQYVLFIICYLAVIWIIEGFGFVYNVDFIAQYYDSIIVVLMGLIGLNLSLFARQLLKLRYRSWFSLSTRILISSSIIVILSPLLLSFKMSIILISILALGITLLSIVCGLFFIHDESKDVRFYVLSLVYFILGIDIHILTRFGWLSEFEFADYISGCSALIVLIYLCWNFAKQMAHDRIVKKDVEKQMTSVNERYYSVFQNAAEGMFTTSIEGNILAINKSMCRTLGFINLEDMHKSGHSKADEFYADPQLRATIMETLRIEGEVNSIEMSGYDRYGEIFHGEINMRLNIQPDITIIDGSFVNTTKRKQHEIKLESIAKYDQLTGLVNRSHFEKLVGASLEANRSVLEDNILLYLDLDQFKLVNDICGHDVGDSLLKKITVVLKSFLDESAILARLGGDEFGILLNHTNFDNALEFADTIRCGIEDFRFTHNGRHFVLGVSIGIVTLDESIENFSQALSLADTACFTAKAQGRNRVHVYSKCNDVMLGHQREMRWIGVLREALDENRFELAFQTIKPLSASIKEGYRYEILLRLRDEDGNLQSPSEFIAAAENYNFMSQLDRWVVKTYCQWLSSNPKHLANLSSASINLCGQSLVDRSMHSYIENTILTYGIPPEKLCFEITESQAIMDFDQTILFMNKFKALGCRFSLDDFGSGFSSYSYIKRLPIDQLKIDGSFVRNIETDNVDYTMVKSFNEIAKAVNIKTVAEYVENENIKNILSGIGIDYVQGYLIAKPALLVDLVDNEQLDSA